MAETRDIQVQETEKQEIDESGAERTRAGACFVPRVDIYETNEGMTVIADMPGINEENIDITLEQNVLTINGYVASQRPEDYSLAYAEYRVGDYQRRFTLSDQIDKEKIEATVKDGVLRLQLPKAEPATKKISVTAG